MKHVLLTVVSLVLYSGCSEQPEDIHLLFREANLEDIEVIIDTETHSEIGQPSGLLSVKDGFLLYDYSAKQIFKYDLEGNLQYSFGNEGDGPGEFRFIAGMWDLDEGYLLYDRNGAKHLLYSKNGAFLEEFALEGEGFSNAMAVASFGRYFIPSNGENGSLVYLIDAEQDGRKAFGTAVAEASFDFDRDQQTIKAGNVPPYMQNQVLLSSNDSGVFVFQQTTAMLQKFSNTGELQWERDLTIPEMEPIFDRFLDVNKTMMDRGMRNMLLLQYANELKAAENGVYTLINTTENQPVILIWVSGEGDEMVILRHNRLEDVNPDLFSVSQTGNQIVFSSRMDGTVYKARWGR